MQRDLFGHPIRSTAVPDAFTRHLETRKLADPTNPRDPAPRRYMPAHSIDPEVRAAWSDLETRASLKRKWKAEAARGRRELHRKSASACPIDWMDLYK
jgi:hypothetical protein